MVAPGRQRSDALAGRSPGGYARRVPRGRASTVAGESAAEAGSGHDRSVIAQPRWDRIRDHAGRSRYVLVVLVAILLVLAGQVAEDVADGGGLEILQPRLSIQRWALLVAVLYMLVVAEAIHIVVRRSLRPLQAVLGLDADEFRAKAEGFRYPHGRLDALLLAISAGIVGLLFLAVGSELPFRHPVSELPMYLPGDALGALLVLAGYTVVGWAGLTMVVGTVRLARRVAELSHQPLTISVFDTSNLLPDRKSVV